MFHCCPFAVFVFVDKWAKQWNPGRVSLPSQGATVVVASDVVDAKARVTHAVGRRVFHEQCGIGVDVGPFESMSIVAESMYHRQAEVLLNNLKPSLVVTYGPKEMAVGECRVPGMR